MSNKIWPYVIVLLASLTLALVGLVVITDESLKGISGICIGIGAGAFGMAIAQIVTAAMMRKNPEYFRRQSIEERDERNIQIRVKAKAKGFDAMGIIFGVAMLCLVLTNANISTVLLIVGAYLLVYVVQIYYIAKYSKEF